MQSKHRKCTQSGARQEQVDVATRPRKQRLFYVVAPPLAFFVGTALVGGVTKKGSQEQHIELEQYDFPDLVGFATVTSISTANVFAIVVKVPSDKLN